MRSEFNVRSILCILSSKCNWRERRRWTRKELTRERFRASSQVFLSLMLFLSKWNEDILLVSQSSANNYHFWSTISPMREKRKEKKRNLSSCQWQERVFLHSSVIIIISRIIDEQRRGKSIIDKRCKIQHLDVYIDMFDFVDILSSFSTSVTKDAKQMFRFLSDMTKSRPITQSILSPRIDSSGYWKLNRVLLSSPLLY